jgi:hypothetical protein
VVTVSEPSCCLTLIEKIVGHSHFLAGILACPRRPAEPFII